MQINRDGLNIIKAAEGCELKPYRCPAGILSIGWGHVIQQNETELLDGITKEQAETLLEEDVRVAERTVMQAVRVPLTDNQFSALVSFVFNIGGGNFRNSTMLRLLNRNDLLAAAQEFDRWVFAGDKKLPGLVTRRKAEKALFLRPALCD